MKFFVFLHFNGWCLVSNGVQRYFIETLQFYHGRVYRGLSRTAVHAVIYSRGKKTQINRPDDSDIVAHIIFFSAYQSDYSRKSNPDRKYHDTDLNIIKMYDLYVQKLQSEGKEALK